MDPLQDIPFETLRGYRVIRRLATGGTSDVLLAKAEGPHGFERTVVLKLLLAHFRNEELMEKMFAREASAYARLSHPAIVKLYDFFSEAGQLVMALEYVDGIPLHRLRAMLKTSGDALDDRASIFIAARIFAALAAAHAARDPESGEFAPVIHRDVNPSNVLIPWDGHVKLADFGIAKVAGIQGDTQAGFIKGTYGYMAPEQVKGEPITVRTDVYSASLLLWELLARRKAIQRGALPEMEVLRAMAEPSIVSLDVLRPDLPARLRTAVTRGLEPVPDQRAITAEEMLVVLRESVTSNEGRMVLESILSRMRNPPSDLTSTSPHGSQPMKDPAIHAAVQSALAIQGKPLAPPLEDPQRSIDTRRASNEMAEAGRASSPRDALGTTQASAGQTSSAGAGTHMPAGSASAALARSEPPPPPAAPAAAPSPKPQIIVGQIRAPVPRPMASTLRMGGVQEVPAEMRGSGERPGVYRSVGTPARPFRQERTMRGLAPQVPPGFRLDDTAPSTSPMPFGIPPSSGPTTKAFPPAEPVPSPAPPPEYSPPPAAYAPSAPNAPSSPSSPSSMPPVLGGFGPAPAAPQTSPAASTVASPGPLGETARDPFGPRQVAQDAPVRDASRDSLPPAFGSAPMPLPISTAPPAIPSMGAPFDPFAQTFAAGAPGALYAPPPPMSPMAMTPYPAGAPNGAPSMPPEDMRRAPTLPGETSLRRPPPWGLITGIFLIASVAVVAVVLLAQRRARTIARMTPTMTVTAPTSAPTTSTTIATPTMIASSISSSASASTVATPVASASSPAPLAAPSAHASAAVVASASAAPLASAAPVEIPPNMGDVKLPASAAGHRVFVDGKVAGNGADTIRVRCGSRAIKIGSSGVERTVDVPCGGELTLDK